MDLYIDQKKYKYARKATPLSRIDLASWMARQTIFPKVYWKDRDDEEERVAIGSLLEYSQMPREISCEEETRLYGGRAFSQNQKSKLWQNFPSEIFFLPKYEVVQTLKSTTLIAHMLDSLNGDHGNELTFDFPLIAHKKIQFSKREDVPAKDVWLAKVEKCLHHIEQKKVQKVVLARKTTMTYEEEFSPYSLFIPLLQTPKRATYFAFQMEPSSLFFGASPEKLFVRNKGEIRTEALAGTFPRGKSKEEDEKLRLSLLQSEKEKREFELVNDFLKEALLPHCKALIFEEGTKIFQTPFVQHLYRQCYGKLTPQISDRNLLDILHPTPALGGMPRQAALEYLQGEEPFYRGWYAGPIGWGSPRGASFSVAIRSLLATQKQVNLFAGAGIVAGSDPLKEWNELEYKISQFLDFL